MGRKTITVQAELFKIVESVFANDGSTTLRPMLQCKCGYLYTSDYITSDTCPYCGCSAQIPIFFDMEIKEVN